MKGSIKDLIGRMRMLGLTTKIVENSISDIILIRDSEDHYKIGTSFNNEIYISRAFYRPNIETNGISMTDHSMLISSLDMHSSNRAWYVLHIEEEHSGILEDTLFEENSNNFKYDYIDKNTIICEEYLDTHRVGEGSRVVRIEDYNNRVQLPGLLESELLPLDNHTIAKYVAVPKIPLKMNVMGEFKDWRYGILHLDVQEKSIEKLDIATSTELLSTCWKKEWLKFLSIDNGLSWMEASEIKKKIERNELSNINAKRVLALDRLVFKIQKLLASESSTNRVEKDHYIIRMYSPLENLYFRHNRKKPNEILSYSEDNMFDYEFMKTCGFRKFYGVIIITDIYEKKTKRLAIFDIDQIVEF